MKPPAKADPRQQRLAQALRANLARRKAQNRAREDQPTGNSPAGGADSAPPANKS